MRGFYATNRCRDKTLAVFTDENEERPMSKVTQILTPLADAIKAVRPEASASVPYKMMKGFFAQKTPNVMHCLPS